MFWGTSVLGVGAPSCPRAGQGLDSPLAPGTGLDACGGPAKGSRALPGCWPETLQEGKGPGLCPGKVTWARASLWGEWLVTASTPEVAP